MRHAFILLTVFLLLSLPSAGRAQPDHCDKAKNTTDMVNCANRHYEDAQERLNAAYKKNLENKNDENAEGLSITQRSWLVYRDLQCGWEASEAETKAIKRLTELSCLANLTENRADILARELEEENGIPPQHKFSAYPRWMNVLAEESPGVYWRYGEPVRVDLDCDGQDEQVMVGVDVVGNSKINTMDGTATYKSEVIIAVAENPVTGKPQTSLFRLPAEDANGQESICNPDVELVLVGYPLAGGDKSSAENGKDVGAPDIGNCRVAVQIRDNQCSPLTLYWDGSGYQFIQAPPGP